MKFLILNRFDPLSPKAAGAELFTSELASRLVRDGHSVTWFSSQFKGAPSEDEYKGIKVIRKGNILSVLWWAFRYYMKRKNEFDFVIDEVHAYPFLAKFYVPKSKRIALVHEVTGKIWYYMAPYYTFHLPLGIIGDILERIMYRFFYRSERFLTVSESTRSELIKYGVKEKNISVLSEGITLSSNASKKVEKSEKPQIVYFGGLRPLKRIEHQLAALKDLKQDFPYLRYLV
ncbi:MAG: glycosyltransferase, partial [Candidatus Dojkabacteria bacterium]